MKVNIFGIALIIALLFSVSFAQESKFDEQSFFLKIEESYFTLANSGLTNFTTLVTSSKFSKFAKDTWNNSEIFPLQLIWFNPDKIYISQNGVPAHKGKEEELMKVNNGLKQQLKGILVDLQRFYFSGLFKSIPENYTLRHNEEAVQITYESGEGLSLTRVKYLLGYNGLLLTIEVYYPAEDKMIIINPKFRTVKTKWLCEGWGVQTVKKGEVISGFNLKIESLFLENVWVPSEILIEVQRIDQPGQTFYDILSLKNYMFNQSIELK